MLHRNVLLIPGPLTAVFGEHCELHKWGDNTGDDSHMMRMKKILIIIDDDHIDDR